MKLIFEAARTIRAQPVASVVTGLIVAGVCIAILSTTGQTVRAERQVLSRIDAAGTRSIVILDSKGTAGMTPDVVDRLARVSGVQWVIGLGPATDVRAAGNPGGNPAAVRELHGEIPPEINIDRLPIESGNALVGADAQTTLGLELPVGGVVSGTGSLAVVGAFRATDPLDFLNRGLITRPSGTESNIRSAHILVESPSHVVPVTDAALMLIAAQDPSSIEVETSEALAAIRSAVEGELGRYGRQLVTFILTTGLVLTGLNVYSSVTTRRRDFGRRRALGASRSTIILLISTQTFMTAVVGAIVGSASTAVGMKLLAGEATDVRFSIAIIVLSVFAAVIAAVPPALVAAYRDPVRVLRVP